jgi:uncharacterized protein with FMN-binding domain
VGVRRISLWFAATAVLMVLLFTYRTSTSGAGAPALDAARPGIVVAGPGVPASPGDTAGPSASGSAPAANPPPAAPTLVNGSAEDTRWGTVQVRVAVSAGRIVDVVVLRQPDGNPTDQEINSYALPQLREQVLGAQSAQIDGVSGATVTSDGYRASVRSALDLIHFGH